MQLSELKDIYNIQNTSLNKLENGLERLILKDLPEIKTHALVIKGIRRCGKSTLLRQFITKLGKPYFYLNFDDLRLTSFSNADYKLLDIVIKESGANLLFFDEIQMAQKWEMYARQKLDEGFQLVITGSNASLLSLELGTHLTGRHISKELFPFSYEEYCSFFSLKKNHESLNDYLEKGGFPEYLKTNNIDIITQLQSDILYRDIVARYGIRDVSSLRRLFIYLISNPSQLFSPSNLKSLAGVKSHNTVLEYISYFESAYLIYLLPCFSYSLKAQNLMPKKIYVSDSGIIKTGSFSFSKNNGAMLENFIYCTLREKFGIPDSIGSVELYYFKGKNGGECDFIISPNNNTQCIQVCWELNIDNQKREINGLLEAMDFFKQKTGTVITFNTEDLILIDDKTINVIPAWKFDF